MTSETEVSRRAWMLRIVVVILLRLCVAGFAPLPRSSSCNINSGRWVRRGSPRYSGWNCPYMRSGWNCDKNGRQDRMYQMYRWQPNSCKLTPYSPSGFKYLLKNKVMVFYGDSLVANMYEGLLCNLYSSGFQLERTKKTFKSKAVALGYLVKGIRMQVFYIQSGFLVEVQRYSRSYSGTGGHGFYVDYDKPDWILQKVASSTDVLIMGSGVWWSPNVPGRKWPNIYRSDGQPRDISHIDAYQKGMMTVANYLRSIQYQGLPYFISMSPSHRNFITQQGACATLWPLPDPQQQEFEAWAQNYLAVEQYVFQNNPVRLLDITHISAYRADAHPGLYWTSQQPATSTDCTHWCLPGVPDTWLDVLYHTMILEPMLNP